MKDTKPKNDAIPMKYEIVRLLKTAAPRYVSGSEIGSRLHVSRTAIWKHMEELREEGYMIEASSRKGYRLIPSGERLNAWEISSGLHVSVVGRKVVYFDTLDSTNRYAGKLAAEGCEEGTAVIAGCQTGGRGRLGRSWESPAGKGIYLSIVLRPPMAPFETPILTLAAAVAAVEAIKSAAGIDAGIKWPNDLIVNGKKLCGILLEMNSESDQVNYVILGIGINYSQSRDDFPDELKERAISLKMAAESAEFGRVSVIQALLRELDAMITFVLKGENNRILDLWRKHSVTLGREIHFKIKDTCCCGTAVDIAEDGRLVVECADGIRRELLSGEISIRGVDGYV